MHQTMKVILYFIIKNTRRAHGFEANSKKWNETHYANVINLRNKTMKVQYHALRAGTVGWATPLEDNAVAAAELEVLDDDMDVGLAVEIWCDVEAAVSSEAGVVVVESERGALEVAV